jgi:hypothetical protein
MKVTVARILKPGRDLDPWIMGVVPREAQMLRHGIPGRGIPQDKRAAPLASHRAQRGGRRADYAT